MPTNEATQEPALSRDGVVVSRSPWGPEDEIGRLNLMTPESIAVIVGRLDGRRVFDLAVDCLPDSYEIGAAELALVARTQGVELRRGDIVLIRTGRMTRWPDPSGYLADSPGLGLEGARYLCEDVGAMCVGADTVGLEALPSEEGTFLPVHAYMFATAGSQIIEVVNCEELSRERQFEFAFIAAPIKLNGTTGAPVRPIAIPLTT